MLGNGQMMDRLRAWLTEEQGDFPATATRCSWPVAALLVEAAQVDGALGERERAAVQRLLERKFRLSAEASPAVAATCERQAARSTQLLGFSRNSNVHVPADQRGRAGLDDWG